MNLALLTGFGPKIMVRAPFERFFLQSAALWWRHGTRMSDDDPDARRLAELEERLKKARGQRIEQPQHREHYSQLGIAFRLLSELLAAVLVGGGVGWALDQAFGTSPLLLILLFLTGMAAGVITVVRTARQMENNRPSGKP